MHVHTYTIDQSILRHYIFRLEYTALLYVCMHMVIHIDACNLNIAVMLDCWSSCASTSYMNVKSIELFVTLLIAKACTFKCMKCCIHHHMHVHTYTLYIHTYVCMYASDDPLILLR